uniref:Uncharacterized protein n=1 Tax=Podoviridae sp. ct8Lf7 TaxID=2827723 RepID=A0A8S5S1F9_9CAUD|nr:MAG TPA: hypothetical protein [Podoviridae sp. ct8Lf7]
MENSIMCQWGILGENYNFRSNYKEIIMLEIIVRTTILN